MRTVLAILLVALSACAGGVPSQPIDVDPGVLLRCDVPDPDCTASYRLAMEAVDQRFAPGVARATVRRTDVHLCTDGEPEYDVELTDGNNRSIEMTIARMRNGRLVACTY